MLKLPENLTPSQIFQRHIPHVLTELQHTKTRWTCGIVPAISLPPCIGLSSRRPTPEQQQQQQTILRYFTWRNNFLNITRVFSVTGAKMNSSEYFLSDFSSIRYVTFSLCHLQIGDSDLLSIN